MLSVFISFVSGTPLMGAHAVQLSPLSEPGVDSGAPEKGGACPHVHAELHRGPPQTGVPDLHVPQHSQVFNANEPRKPSEGEALLQSVWGDPSSCYHPSKAAAVTSACW